MVSGINGSRLMLSMVSGIKGNHLRQRLYNQSESMLING